MEEVAIKPIAEDHLADVQAHAAHPEIARWSTVPSPYPADGAVRWYDVVSARRALGECQVFCITAHGRFAGVISLNAANGDWATASVDYWVAVPFQGRGVATAAVGLAIARAKADGRVRQLVTYCIAANAASVRVLIKNGFTETRSVAVRAGPSKGQHLSRLALALPRSDESKAAPNHNTIIARAARNALRPLGCTQKGRSRTWHDDHGWWIAVIEFQPSGWSKGTYLNVGACWLWYPKGYESFDEGYRVGSFASAADLDAFAAEVEGVASRARDEVLGLRERFATPGDVAAYLRDKEADPRAIWAHYHAGVACGVVGWATDAAERLRMVATSTEDREWAMALKAEATRLLACVNDTNAFRERVSALVAESRALIKLGPLPGPAFT